MNIQGGKMQCRKKWSQLPKIKHGLIDLPLGKKEMSSQWMQLKSKLGLEGQGNKLKAHLVALGFELEYGIDHGEAFALQSSETLLETW